MKLNITGNCKVNTYYVQTLCMIFFPETHFSSDADNGGDNSENVNNYPELILNVFQNENGTLAKAEMRYNGNRTFAEEYTGFSDRYPNDRATKIAIGGAVIKACSSLLNYQPAWGMLTGVRPSKVATEMLDRGLDRDEIVKNLMSEYFVIPKKASLATDVAINESKIIGTPSKRDCSIYISIPFCPSRCAYCSFVSYTSGRLLSLIPEYLVRLCYEIERISQTVKKFGLNVMTIYIGGGTPTILTPEQLDMLLGKVEKCFDLSSVREYTLESGRPDTITEEKFRVAKEHGVTRISVNPQTLSNSVLEKIGRHHTVDDFFRAYDIALESGIKCINTDLIVGLPGDSFPMFAKTMDKILNMRPQNVTIHTFCVKKSADILKNGTEIYSVHGGDVGQCVDYSQIKSIQSGYLPYYMYRQKKTVGNFENVGFALPGTEGLYNVYMMEEVHSIFAAGAGAVSKLVDYKKPVEGKTQIVRYFNPKYPYEYLSRTEKEGFADFEAIEKFYSELI